MESDGSLLASRAQDGFARNYNDGIGHAPSAPDLLIFGDREADEVESLSSASAAPLRTPHTDIHAAIDETALRYAGHPGLRAANITVTDWLHLYRANIEIESGYDPAARSHAGAIGLGQLMSGTAAELGVDPHDWRQNLDGSARYLAMMLAEFGDARFALAAYNAGPEAVREHSGIPPFAETQTHVQRVLAVFNRPEGETR